MIFNYKNKKIEIILITYSGSRLYGTQYEKGENPFNKDYISDHDWKAIFIEDIKSKLSLIDTPLEQIEIKENTIDKDNLKLKNELFSYLKSKNLKYNQNDDFTLYELSKFFKLLMKNNPNVLDILNVPKDKIIYSNNKTKNLLKNKNLFLSQEIKNSFIKYAIGQLSRIKGHYKYLNNYPKIYIVHDLIKQAVKDKKINHQWISKNINSDLANYFSKNKIKNSFFYKYEDFIKDYIVPSNKITINEFIKYRKPFLIEFCFPKTLTGKKINLNEKIYNYINNNVDKNNIDHNLTVKNFLIKYAVFRPISKTQYNIFLPYDFTCKNNGLFTNEGNLKNNPSEKIGNFVFQLTIDDLNFKKENDLIKKLWKWKVHRNEKRSDLEKFYGYDTKHALHLYRLLIKAKEILETESYNPVLKGNLLKECLKIRNGEISYEKLIYEVEKIQKEIINYDSKLQLNNNKNKINDLYFSILDDNSLMYLKKNDLNIKI